jgi:hypothetical protein
MPCSKMVTMAAIDVVQQDDDGDISASGSSCLSELNNVYCILLGETLLWLDWRRACSKMTTMMQVLRRRLAYLYLHTAQCYYIGTYWHYWVWLLKEDRESPAPAANDAERVCRPACSGKVEIPRSCSKMMMVRWSIFNSKILVMLFILAECNLTTINSVAFCRTCNPMVHSASGRLRCHHRASKGCCRAALEISWVYLQYLLCSIVYWYLSSVKYKKVFDNWHI